MTSPRMPLAVAALLLLLAAPALDAQGSAPGEASPAAAGREALAAGDLDRAIDLLRQAAELDPEDSMVRTWLGRAYIDKLQTVSFFEKGVLAGRAMEALEKAVALDPANVEARVTLAGYYVNAPSIAGGSKRKARLQADAILELDPPRGQMLLADLHMKDEEWDAAAEALGRCLEAEPGQADCRYRLGMLHQERERFADAFASFETMLQTQPDSRAALYQLGRTAVFSGERVERGMECLERYLELDVAPGFPGHDGAHWRLGMLHETRGDTARARAEYESAIALNPDEKRYREALERLGGS